MIRMISSVAPISKKNLLNHLMEAILRFKYLYECCLVITLNQSCVERQSASSVLLLNWCFFDILK